MSDLDPTRPNRESALAGESPRAAKRRDALISAARDLIETVGYERTTMAQVAKLAGLSEGTVYNYFSDRQTLIDAVLEQWALPVNLEIEKAVQGAKNVFEMLHGVAMVHLTAMKQTPKMHLMFYREARWNHYYGSRIHALNRNYVGIFMKGLELAQTTRQISGDIDLALVRDMFFGVLEHVGARTILADRELDIATTARGITDQLLRGIQHSKRTAVQLGEISEQLQTAIKSLNRLSALQDEQD